MKLKNMPRNKDNLPINFCKTGNFLNLNKIKFIPMENSLKIKKPKKLENKKSTSNLSEYQTIKREELTKKDELIKNLKEKIIFLENKIKYLEKDKIKKQTRSRNENDSLNNILILKTEKSHSYKSFNRTNNINKTVIPLDKHLLKEKLSKRKKNLFALINLNKLSQKNKNSSLYGSEQNKLNSFKYSMNYSLSNYNTRNNSFTNSELKPKKKSIRISNINTFQNSLYSMSSKNKNKISYSIEQKKKSIKIEDKKSLNRKIKAIPKKEFFNQNTSTKIMLSSTNYSNNISKDENMTLKKNHSILNNEINNNSHNNNISFNEIKIKLDNIKNRTKKLLEIYSLVNIEKNNKNVHDKKDKIKRISHSHYIKIFKLEKAKK
jgi:hypothetical protein